MEITGQLREDILNGNVVLFLGAGASQIAGLKSTPELANYLYEKAGNPRDYKIFKDDFSRLVAKLDADPDFTRAWVNNQLIDYLLKYKNYKNLETHKKIFKNEWKAIFTTNYDTSLELAEHYVDSHRFRLLPVANPAEKPSVFNTDKGKVRYFKIHGCVKDLEQHPTTSPSLVITQRDYRASIKRNKVFFEELEKLAYNSSIVFIGFNAHRAENNPIMANIVEASNSVATSVGQSFKTYGILKDVEPLDQSDIEDAGIKLLDGSFEEFLDAVDELVKSKEEILGEVDIEQRIRVETLGEELDLSIAERNQYSLQFTFYYNSYLDELKREIESYPPNKILDLWKREPSDKILSKGYYIERASSGKIRECLKDEITGVEMDRTPRVLVIAGKRASGKSTLARQLMKYVYADLKQPSITLSKDANYYIEKDDTSESINISRWNNQLIDKFLSLVYHKQDLDDLNLVPVFLADNLPHRIGVLDNLINYLQNHNKPCVLILTLNPDEFEILNDPQSSEPLLHHYISDKFEINHKLDDEEIYSLFEIVSKIRPEIRDHREELINRAIEPSECDRDILIILYTWFDRNFRKFEEIVQEEIEKLEENSSLKNHYLSIAVFHQYGFSPNISRVAEAVGLSMEEFSKIRSTPLFKGLIDIDERNFATTRHPEFSRKIITKLIPEIEDQIKLMGKTLSACTISDTQFVRGFLKYIYGYGASFNINQVTKLKVATEKNLHDDYVINHQFAAYLIHEKKYFDKARKYLDLADKKYPLNPSIIHSMGNWCYNLFKEKLEKNPERAMEYYEAAEKYFEKSRSLERTADEYGYYTHIDMIRYRLDHVDDAEETRVILKAQKEALLIEALEVVPFERQNYLRRLMGLETPFEKLPDKDKEIIKNQVIFGYASPILLEYYTKSLLLDKSEENWNLLNNIISQYWGSAKTEPTMAIVLCLLAKKAFIKNAESRFELLRTYFDQLIRYKELKINFVLLAEYVRLILIDALVLEKFDFLKTVMIDITEIFREAKPRFLKDEFVLEGEYYKLDESDTERLKKYYLSGIRYSSSNVAERYQKLAFLNDCQDGRFFKIQIDPETGYFIKGICREVTLRGTVDLSFNIKYRFDGFWATNLRT